MAAALVSIVGIIIVEAIRGRQEQEREARREREREEDAKREDKVARMARRRASRNAAQSVLMELSEVARPLESVVRGVGAWEPLRVVRRAWDDQTNRAALNDAMTLDALLDVEAAYRELAAIVERMLPRERGPGHFVPSFFFEDLSRDDWKLGRRILDVHIRPGINRLHIAIATLETLELAEEGRLEEEAARIRAEEGDSAPQREHEEPRSD